jgi:hypothetical protein
VLVCPSSIDLSSRTWRFLTGRLTARRQDIGTRWRRLPASRQALFALAHLRCGDTYAQPAAGPPALPGSTHDLTAARQHGIVEALTQAGLKCWADKAYQGVGGPVWVPFRGRRLKRWKRRHNTTHAKTCCLGEQAMATLKGWGLWGLLRKLRCSTNRITDVVKAVLVLHHAST